VEMEHVAEGAVGEGGGEYWDVVFVGPVHYRRWIVDLLSQARDDRARRPDQFFLVASLLAGYLLGEQLVQDRDHPVFEKAVVVVRDDEVADAVHACFSERGAGSGEGGYVGWGEAFDEVFFDAAGCGYDGGDVAVLDEVAEGGAEAGGDEVGGEAEEDGGFGVGGGLSPVFLGWSR